MVKSIRIVLAAVLGLSFAGASAAGPAAPPRVTLYEISERVIFNPQNPQGTVFIRHAHRCLALRSLALPSARRSF